MNARKLYVIGYYIDGKWYNRGVCVNLPNKHIDTLGIVVSNMDNTTGFGFMYIDLVGKSGEIYRRWKTTHYFRLNPGQRTTVIVKDVNLPEETCYIKAYLYAYY